jgi:hypothetical protein
VLRWTVSPAMLVGRGHAVMMQNWGFSYNSISFRSEPKLGFAGKEEKGCAAHPGLSLKRGKQRRVAGDEEEEVAGVDEDGVDEDAQILMARSP